MVMMALMAAVTESGVEAARWQYFSALQHNTVQCGGSGDGENSGNSIGSGVSDATTVLQERKRSNNHMEEEKIKCNNQPSVTKARTNNRPCPQW